MIDKGFIFYDSWCDMINEYYDKGDRFAAQELAFAITRLYSTGETAPTSRKDLEMMLKYIIKPDIQKQKEEKSIGFSADKKNEAEAETTKPVARKIGF